MLRLNRERKPGGLDDGPWHILIRSQRTTNDTATALEAAIDAYGQAAYERGIDGRPLLSGRSETSTLAQFAAEDALFALSDGIRRGTGRIP